MVRASVRWSALRRAMAACAAVLAALLLVAPAQAEEVLVAAASNFSAPLKRLATAFEQDTGHTLRVAYGSTGKLYAQIRNGAPFAVLLAADAQTPTRLVQEGLALRGSQFTYAVGQLVLWSPQPGLIDGSPAILRSGGFKHLALADPQLAPYGSASVEVLKALGLHQSLRPKLVTGENITQAYQFVRSGNAALGFVALSQVQEDGRMPGSYWRVPADLHSPLRQDAVLLAAGRGQIGARALLQYLQGEKARALIRAFGYGL